MIVREAAHEPLTAQQQLGRETESAPAHPLQRARADAHPLDQFGDRGDFGVDQRLMDRQDPRLAPNRLAALSRNHSVIRASSPDSSGSSANTAPASDPKRANAGWPCPSATTSAR